MTVRTCACVQSKHNFFVIVATIESILSLLSISSQETDGFPAKLNETKETFDYVRVCVLLFPLYQPSLMEFLLLLLLLLQLLHFMEDQVNSLFIRVQIYAVRINKIDWSFGHGSVRMDGIKRTR